MKGSPSLLLAAMLSLPLLAQAAEPAQCSTVNFSDVGWTDITVTTADHQRRPRCPRLQDQDHDDFRAGDLQVPGRRQEHGRVPG